MNINCINKVNELFTVGFYDCVFTLRLKMSTEQCVKSQTSIIARTCYTAQILNLLFPVQRHDFYCFLSANGYQNKYIQESSAGAQERAVISHLIDLDSDHGCMGKL